MGGRGFDWRSHGDFCARCSDRDQLGLSLKKPVPRGRLPSPHPVESCRLSTLLFPDHPTKGYPFPCPESRSVRRHRHKTAMRPLRGAAGTERTANSPVSRCKERSWTAGMPAGRDAAEHPASAATQSGDSGPSKVVAAQHIESRALSAQTGCTLCLCQCTRADDARDATQLMRRRNSNAVSIQSRRSSS